MKKVILSIFITLITVGFAAAQGTVSLRQGDQKTVARKLTIRFLEVTDDSRCPVGTECVWAGNAKVKLALRTRSKRAREFDLNSTTEPTSIDYNGYRIKFVSLTRRPTQPGRMTMVRPELVLSVAKIRH